MSTLVGGHLHDAAVEQVDGPGPDAAPRLQRVLAAASRNDLGQAVLTVPCGRCGEHVHGARSMPGVFYGGCGRPVIVESATWADGTPFEIEET